ncbi:unnamed protein product [Nezara viridula]|uniref:Gamma-secretase subunit PEN-2 n=1 Tax=Nezara viridula TaxID=85310 RepID=A0A9P0MCW5_NEZVI|nr:unnamed protein product [Nezara viridula]
MDLSKVKNNEKLELCSWYFRAGFFGLPIVWFVNAVWFFNEAFRKPVYEEQRAIKRYVIFSGIGALIWSIVIGTWVYIFQSYRVAFGEFGDSISFVIPTGVP